MSLGGAWAGRRRFRVRRGTNIQPTPPRASQTPRRTWAQHRPRQALMAAKIMQSMVLEQVPEGRRINTGTMTDLPTLAAILLSNFATVHIPRRESLWTDPKPELPLEAHCRSLAIAIKDGWLIARCHQQHLRLRILEAGHRGFLDRLEGGGPEGWRLHFFSLDPSIVTVLNHAGVGKCSPGAAKTFNAEGFVARRLRKLE
jgi:hypothetical protein